MNRTLVILRGCPSSGKTSFAELMSENGKYPVCSADHFFEKDGQYNWKAELVSTAHKFCQDNTELHMQHNVEKIFVANTFTTEKELAPYYALAEQYGYKVFSIIVEKRHTNTNNHNVPEETIQKMKNRFSIKLT